MQTPTRFFNNLSLLTTSLWSPKELKVIREALKDIMCDFYNVIPILWPQVKYIVIGRLVVFNL